MGLGRIVKIKPLLARGLPYYTGNIFELLSIVPCCNINNVFVKIGSLLSGGRYDNFLNNGKQTLSLGVSLGISRALDFRFSLCKPFNKGYINYICICWPQYECFNPRLLLEINYIKQNGYKIKIAGSASFNIAIKRITNESFLFYKWRNG